MARKFLDSEEAARMLGVSVEKLNELRDRKEVYPVRDGGQWKYKQDDLERYVAERQDASNDVDLPSGEYDEEGGLDSILLSEVELGHSGHSPSSTVIGKGEGGSSDSDIQLVTDSQAGKGEKKKDKKSDKKLAAPLSRLPDSPSELPNPGSDVRLASGSSSDSLKAGSGLSKKFDELDALDLELPPALSSGGSGRIDTGPASGVLALDADSLSLEGEPHSKAGGGSSQRAAGSAIDLSGQDDDDLVLGGGSSGSDLTHSSGGDSGISLIDPSDSGLALDDEGLDVKPPSSKTSLNLGGDDDLILLEEEADPNVATQLKADDDFLLTPMDDGGGQDSDSGSQVIALDSESDFDESAATMLGKRAPVSGMLEAEEEGFTGGGFEAVGGPSLGMAPAGMPTYAPAAMMAAPQVEEAPFSIWNVLFLMLCVGLLIVSGMMMYDLLRNMWSWDRTLSGQQQPDGRDFGDVREIGLRW